MTGDSRGERGARASSGEGGRAGIGADCRHTDDFLFLRHDGQLFDLRSGTDKSRNEAHDVMLGLVVAGGGTARLCGRALGDEFAAGEGLGGGAAFRP